MSIDLADHMKKAMSNAGLPSTKVAELDNVKTDWMFADNTQRGMHYQGEQAPGTVATLKGVRPSGTNPGKPANSN